MFLWKIVRISAEDDFTRPKGDGIIDVGKRKIFPSWAPSKGRLVRETAKEGLFFKRVSKYRPYSVTDQLGELWLSEFLNYDSTRSTNLART